MDKRSIGLFTTVEDGLHVMQMQTEDIAQLFNKDGIAPLNPRSMHSPLGVYASQEMLLQVKPEEFKDLLNEDQVAKFTNIVKIMVVAPFVGIKLENHILHFRNHYIIEANFIKHLKETEAAARKADQLLYATVDGIPFAVYNPDVQVFVPRGGTLPDMTQVENLLLSCKEVAKRYCAFYFFQIDSLKEKRSKLEEKKKNSNDEVKRHIDGKIAIINNRIANLQYLADEEKEQYEVVDFDYTEYRNESKLVLSGEVKEYLEIVNPGENHALAFGFYGTLDSTIMVDEIIAVTTEQVEKSSVILKDQVVQIDDCVYLLPPVKETIDAGSFEIEMIGGTPNDPNAISVRVKKNGELYRKVFFKEAGWRFATPDCIIDLANGVPEGKLMKYQYVSFLPAVREWPGHGKVVDAKYNLLPDEGVNQESSEMELAHDEEHDERQTWVVYERRSKAQYVQLIGKDGTIYSTLPCTAGHVGNPARNMIISLDTGGNTTVVLVEDGNGNQMAHAPIYEKTSYPVVPVDEKTFADFVKLTLENNHSGENDDKRESMMQTHNMKEGTAGNTEIGSRTWNVSAKTMMHATEGFNGDADTLVGTKGILVDLKNRALSYQNLLGNAGTLTYLKKYMANVLRPIILGALASGYEFNPVDENGMPLSRRGITLLLSYPDNGRDDPSTKIFQDVIDGAVAYLNQMLPSNHQIGTHNYHLFSEAQATTAYQLKLNPTLIQGLTVVEISDIGATTNDITIRIRESAYSLSVRMAGNEITRRTMLMMIKKSDVQSIANCFNLKQGSTNTRKDIEDVVRFAKHALDKLNGNQYVSDSVSACMACDYLFKDYDFRFTTIADLQWFRIGTEQRLLCLIPFYAYVMKLAFDGGDLRSNAIIKFMPAGNGSKAFDNTRRGFKDHFQKSIAVMLNAMLDGKEFTGSIDFVQNYDAKKHSVSEGMMYLHRNEAFGGGMLAVANRNVVNIEADADYYISMICGEDNAAYQKLQTEYETAKEEGFEEKENFIAKMKIEAYNQILDNYTMQMFKEDYIKFFMIGDLDISVSKWDKSMRTFIQDQERSLNVLARVRATKQNLIMGCHKQERYALAAAMINEFTDDVIEAVA